MACIMHTRMYICTVYITSVWGSLRPAPIIGRMWFPIPYKSITLYPGLFTSVIGACSTNVREGGTSYHVQIHTWKLHGHVEEWYAPGIKMHGNECPTDHNHGPCSD